MDTGTDTRVTISSHLLFLCVEEVLSFALYLQFNREMKGKTTNFPLFALVPYSLYYKMNHINTKLSFLANKQDSCPL